MRSWREKSISLSTLEHVRNELVSKSEELVKGKPATPRTMAQQSYESRSKRIGLQLEQKSVYLLQIYDKSHLNEMRKLQWLPDD